MSRLPIEWPFSLQCALQPAFDLEFEQQCLLKSALRTQSATRKLNAANSQAMTLRVSAGISVLPSAANDRLPADLDDIQTVSWQVLSHLFLFE